MCYGNYPSLQFRNFNINLYLMQFEKDTLALKRLIVYFYVPSHPIHLTSSFTIAFAYRVVLYFFT